MQHGLTRHISLPGVSLRAIAVWRRNFLVWKKLAIPSVLGNLADPMIYLFGLGYGLGSLLPASLPQLGGVSYIAYFAAGTVCASTMHAASFEALYSAFSRMHVQRTWEAILNAPVTLDDIVLGELLWGATKAVLSGVAILLVIAAFGFVDFAAGTMGSAGDLPHRTGICRSRADRHRTRAELRFLHVLLHLVHHANGAALRRLLSDRTVAGSAAHGFRLAAIDAHGGLVRPLIFGRVPDNIGLHVGVLALTTLFGWWLAQRLTRRRLLK